MTRADLMEKVMAYESGELPEPTKSKAPHEFITIQELCRPQSEPTREWLVPALLSFGSLVCVAGPPKLAGKTTWVWALIAAAQSGLEFLGHVLPKTSAVVLTEEGNYDLIERCHRFGLTNSRTVVLQRRKVRGVLNLEDTADQAMLLAKDIGAKMLVVDTFSAWGGLDSGAENDASSVSNALRPLLRAADAGMLVLLIHHTKKSGSHGGVALRGSSALSAEVDATITLQRKGAGNVRSLKIESRYESIGACEVELIEGTGEPPSYRVINGGNDRLGEKIYEDRVLGFLSGEGEGCWHTMDQLTSSVSGSKRVEAAVRRLVNREEIQRIGDGRKGAAFLYAKLGLSLPGDSAIPDHKPTPNSGSPGVDTGSRTSNLVATDSGSPSPPPLGGGTGTSRQEPKQVTSAHSAMRIAHDRQGGTG